MVQVHWNSKRRAHVDKPPAGRGTECTARQQQEGLGTASLRPYLRARLELPLFATWCRAAGGALQPGFQRPDPELFSEAPLRRSRFKAQREALLASGMRLSLEPGRSLCSCWAAQLWPHWSRQRCVYGGTCRGNAKEALCGGQLGTRACLHGKHLKNKHLWEARVRSPGKAEETASALQRKRRTGDEDRRVIVPAVQKMERIEEPGGTGHIPPQLSRHRTADLCISRFETGFEPLEPWSCTSARTEARSHAPMNQSLMGPLVILCLGQREYRAWRENFQSFGLNGYGTSASLLDSPASLVSTERLKRPAVYRHSKPDNAVGAAESTAAKAGRARKPRRSQHHAVLSGLAVLTVMPGDAVGISSRDRDHVTVSRALDLREAPEQ
ncbi:unnamed protein product, partial [Symbiodinium necroappetens]